MVAERVIPDVFTVYRGAYDASMVSHVNQALCQLRAAAPDKDGRRIVRLGVPYKYMGRPLKHAPIPALLQPLLESVRGVCGVQFNAMVVNWYRDGGVALPPHSDTACIRELGTFPKIAGLSFGASREFLLTPRSTKSTLPSGRVTLHAGDLYVMSGVSQQKYYHSMPASSVSAPRVSVTFRCHG